MNWLLLLIAVTASAGWARTFFLKRQAAISCQRLHREIDLIKKCIQACGAGIYRYDVKKDVTYWDEKSKHIFGRPDLSDPIPPGFWEKAITPEDRLNVLDHAVDLLHESGSAIMAHEYRTILPSGETRWVSGTAYVKRDQNGKPIETFGFHFDISAQKEYEQALIRERKLAVQSLKAKSQFLANMSHEIRTPMNAILGMMELLDDGTLNPTQNSYMRTVKNSGNVLMHIIDDILDLSKMEEGKLKLERASFNLRSTVKQCLSVYTQASDQKDIFLGAHIDPRIPEMIRGDSTRLQQILMNLIGNAFKFTQHGSIKVVIKACTQDQIKISVTDTGIGIKKENLSTLFERFDQGQEDTTKKFGGSGLGLTIIKNIVDLWNGQFGVESEYGKGSTFWCKLPIEELLLSIDKTTPDAAILVCSQYTEVAGLWNLDEFAPELVFADNVELFKRLFSQRHYDHVIAEQIMPESSGPELLEWVKSISPETFTTLIGFEKQIGQNGDLPYIDRYCATPYLIQEVWVKQQRNQLADKNDTEVSKYEWPNYSHLSVLVVDDNQTSLLVIKGLLKRFGIMAHSCLSGTESIEICKSKRFDLILMDYEMPDMNGPSAARQILQSYPHLIIGLSAHVGTEFIDACMASGMTDYMSKPVNVAALTALLDSHFSTDQKPVNQA